MADKYDILPNYSNETCIAVMLCAIANELNRLNNNINAMSDIAEELRQFNAMFAAFAKQVHGKERTI